MLILLPPSEKKSSLPGAAISVYTGVLYAALGWSTLNKAAQNRGQKSIMIISAKYGALHPLDEIEPYKEKIDTAKMRAPISQELEKITSDLIIDCRSSTYQAVWSAPKDRCVEIKIFTRVEGVKKVITHMSKKTRGEVVRLLLTYSEIPTSAQQLLAIVSTHFDCTLIENDLANPWVLEVYC